MKCADSAGCFVRSTWIFLLGVLQAAVQFIRDNEQRNEEEGGRIETRAE